jgi:hypothetical protein
MKKIFFTILITGFLIIAVDVQAASIGDSRVFNVDNYYDVIGRNELTGILQKISSRAYFYVDENWWQTLDFAGQSRVRTALDSLSNEFDENIYPKLTGFYGFEWRPGIDGDYRILILIHPMKEGSGGYFNSGDEYSKLENSRSNEKEMVYLNSDHIESSLAKSFLAHEFVHLISFNQKERIEKISEEIWLNEARAEYASTLLGYDNYYQISNLKERVSVFLKNPSDSITEWNYNRLDYGALNLFTQYLVDQYGSGILSQSLKTNKIGIESLNYVLKQNNIDKDFSQIFTDWTIAVLVNDCSLGKYYCYKNENLKDLEVTPSLNFLPISGKSTLGVSQASKNWAGNWFKFIGGSGTLKLEFIGNPDNLFKVPYLIKDYSDNYSIKFLQLNQEQRGEVFIPGLGTIVNSVIIIPSIQTKTSGFSSSDPAVSYFWSVSVLSGEEEKAIPKYLEKPIAQMSRTEIINKITEIEALLAQLKVQLGVINPSTDISVGNKPGTVDVSCGNFNEDLSYGLRNDSRVRCLQEFLKKQGSDIYPEGLITGNFLALTKIAVIRFQEKYASEVLAPFSLFGGTGFVGLRTRDKINQLIK